MHKTIHFWNPYDMYDKTNIFTLSSEKLEHVSILTRVEISRSTWPSWKYVAYQKKKMLRTLSTKSDTFNKYRTVMPISLLRCSSKRVANDLAHCYNSHLYANFDEINK